jgi:hypothetical protein
VLPITRTTGFDGASPKPRSSSSYDARGRAWWKTSVCGHPVADEVVPHLLVLHDVPLGVRADRSLADRVVPAGHVADHGKAEAAGRGEEGNGRPGLEVRDDEPVAVVAHPLQQGARDVPPRAEVPAVHRPLEPGPFRQPAGAVRIEEPVVVAAPHALAVEAVAKAHAQGERVEADVVVEEPVDAAKHPLAGADATREQRLRVEDGKVADARQPRLGALADEDEREPVRKGGAQAVDDPAVEEDPRRERVGQDEPDVLHGMAGAWSAVSIRSASDAPSSRWARSASGGVPQAGQPSTP